MAAAGAGEDTGLTGERGAERRAHLRLRRYWSDLSVTGRLPVRAEIDMRDPALGPDYLFMLRVAADPFRSVFIQGGRALREAAGVEPAGARLVELLPASLRADLCGACALAISNRRPVEAHGQITRPHGGRARYRSAFFPVDGDDDNAGGYILGCFGLRDMDS